MTENKIQEYKKKIFHHHLSPPPSIRGRKVEITGKMPVLRFYD